MTAREVIARAVADYTFHREDCTSAILAALSAAGLRVVPVEREVEMRDCLECAGRGFLDGSGATCVVCNGEGEMPWKLAAAQEDQL